MGQFRGVALNDLELTSARLVLGPWRPEHVSAIVAAFRDAEMHRFLAVPDPYTPADAADFLAQVAVPGRASGSALECAVTERDTAAFVGSATIRLGDDPEIGFWIAPHAQGHGYAGEATRTLATWAFELGVPRIRLACDVANLASARTALGAGFRFEGVARNGITSPGFGDAPARRGDLARFARLRSDPPEAVPHAFAPLPAGGLHDGVVQLRAVVAEDAASLAESDDALTLAWSFAGEPPPPDELRRTAARAGLDWLTATVAHLAMVDVATVRVAGSVRLRKPGPPQVGGVGYVVHPDFRGRGYAARAIRLLARWAFEDADFARLELGAKVGNEASLRAAARAGFEPDGVRQRRLRNPDGTFSDEVRYALINPKYA